MFDNIKNYLIVSVVAAALIAGGTAWFLFKNGETKDKELGGQKVLIDIQQDGIKKDAQSDAATDKATTELVKKNDDVVTKAEDTKAKVEQKRNQVDQTYSKLPDTTDNEVAKANAKSQIAIDSLWTQYCTSYPDNETCVKLKGPSK